MTKSEGLISQLSEGIGLPVVVVVGFICVKNVIAGTELWVDDNSEMIAAR